MRSFILPACCWILLLLTAYNFSGCKNKEARVIDTVSTPVVKTVKLVKMPHPYYLNRVALKSEEFYRANDYELVWLNRKKPDKSYYAFIKEVKECDNYGMNQNDYNIDILDNA